MKTYSLTRRSYPAVTWSGSQFLLLGRQSIAFSATGDSGSWKFFRFPPDMRMRGVFADEDGMVIVGARSTPQTRESAVVATASDGGSWTYCLVPPAPRLNSVRRAGALYVAVGEDGVVMTSAELIDDWTRLPGSEQTALGSESTIEIPLSQLHGSTRGFFRLMQKP